MKKKIGTLLATAMILNTVSTVAYGLNPLQSYDLYRDTHPEIYDTSNNLQMPSGEDGAMSDPYANPNDFSAVDQAAEATKTRNETLRDSSRNVFSDQTSTPAWELGPVYYPEPSFDSIVEKYRRSDFAGCLQECMAYVRKYPQDTLGFYYLAMCYTKVSDKDNAIRAYEKVIELNDNPMIVKYATNGRNCVMGNESEKCYQNVNEPELVYPYASVVTTQLTPVDPEDLVQRNIARLKQELSPVDEGDDANNNSGNKKDKDNKKLNLPFGKQDDKLDQFINAPYGNGLSPELNKEYKQLQLKKIQSTINKTNETDNKEYNNMKDIKEFDNKHSDASTVKLAFAGTSKEFEAVMNDPEFVRQRQEYNELSALLGTNDKTQKSDTMVDFLPYMAPSADGSKNLSPEVIQAMMMRSMIGDLNL